LHRLLLDECSLPLVMTSANTTNEPLCFSNEDALQRLKGMVDAFLLNDRPIVRPIDDSVLLSEQDQGPSIVRRARGIVPDPIVCSKHAREPVMAFGGDLKSTICLLNERSAVLSEHIGDLENPRAYRRFLGAGQRLRELLRVEPQRYACDLHPHYHSSKFARSLGADLVEVQHHHAHAVSCMAENHLNGPVLAITCDGTGYGTDGTIWGGEILLARYESFERLAHLTPIPLFGRDAAALEPWRSGAALLFQAFSKGWVEALPHWIDRPESLRTQTATIRMQDANANSLCSSLGRLFDAAAYLLGVCEHNRYEGEAAATLEACARRAQNAPELKLRVTRNESGLWGMNGVALVLDLLRAREEGAELSACARGFHRGVCELFAEATRSCARQTGIRKVVLSGGCFVNRILLHDLADALSTSGLEVYRHRALPSGDGGLSFGQALVAAAQA
jgi:hydrogenase maturation protein HypF